MTWEDFVAENEGPELEEARARYRGDEPPAAGVREPRRPMPGGDAAATSTRQPPLKDMVGHGASSERSKRAKHLARSLSRDGLNPSIDHVQADPNQSQDLDWEDVHTCHAECPCRSGGEPRSDFLGQKHEASDA